MSLPELQIKGGYYGSFTDNFSYFSTKTYAVIPHKNRLGEIVLMMGHYLCLKGVILKIIPKLFFLPLLISSTDLPL